MLKDKEYESCIEEIAKRVNLFFGVEVNNPRTLSARKVAQIASEFTIAKAFDDLDFTLNTALELCGKDGVLLVCGSLYLMGDTRMFLNKNFNPAT
jgi:dihydrofolate synthase/folylpolyglutamate synthase